MSSLSWFWGKGDDNSVLIRLIETSVAEEEEEEMEDIEDSMEERGGRMSDLEFFLCVGMDLPSLTPEGSFTERPEDPNGDVIRGLLREGLSETDEKEERRV